MRKLSVGQKRALAEFFANGAVAWLSAGVIAPFFASKKLVDFIGIGTWGILLTLIFISVSLFISKQVKS